MMLKNILSVVVYAENVDIPYIYKKICHQLKPFKFSSFIIVNNYDETLYYIVNGCVADYVKVGGSNEKHEFTAYKVVLSYICKYNLNFDLLFVMNDTLVKHGKLRIIERLAIFFYFFHLGRDVRGVVAGFKHCPEFIKNFNLPIHEYFNSKFYIVGRHSIDLFNKALDFSFNSVSIKNGDYIVEWSYGYNEFFKKWLNSTTPPCWYQADTLNQHNYKGFIRKAECIVAEHRVSFFLFSQKDALIRDLMPNRFIVKFLSLIRKVW